MFASIAPLGGRAVEIPKDAVLDGKKKERESIKSVHSGHGENNGGSRRSKCLQTHPSSPTQSLIDIPPAPAVHTYHHQEWRKPGGSPRVMFFSHRICGDKGKIRERSVSVSERQVRSSSVADDAAAATTVGDHDDRRRASEHPHCSSIRHQQRPQIPNVTDT